jgi:sec-independent protein translocase protein TatA
MSVPSGMFMNIAGSEWAIIILLALILIFGTKRLPQFSRTIGRAVGEYEKTRARFRQEMEDAAEEVKREAGISKLPRITEPVETERQKLEMIATSLGIDHIGKNDDELRSLIARKMSA